MGTMDDRVIAIPTATSQYILGNAETALHEGGRLVLGAPAEGLPMLKATFREQPNVYCQPLDWKSPKQWTAFFDKTYRRFHRLDTIVAGEEIWQLDGDRFEKAIDTGTRMLLRCLDASVRYAGNELHVIVVSPDAYREVAMIVASIFLRVKLQFQNATVCPTIRMTTISTTGTKAVPAGPPPLTRILVQGHGMDDRTSTQSHGEESPSRKPAPVLKTTTVAAAAV